MSTSQSRHQKSQTTSGRTTDRPYIRRDRDRHGNDRVFVRRFGRSIRLHAAEGSAAFDKEYATALAQLAERKKDSEKPARVTGPHKRTFGWLAARYFGSVEFKGLEEQSQATRRAVIEECLQEDYKGMPMRDCPLDHVTAAKIKFLRDAKAHKGLPGAANNRRKYLSSMFGWAVEDGCAKVNPVRDVRKIRYASGGFHTWEVEEVRRFEARHPIGTKARLAMALMLFLGVRKSDMVRLGPKMLRETTLPDGTVARSIRFKVRKSRHFRADETEKPVLPALWSVLQQSPVGRETFLETQHGKPFSSKGVVGWMRARCDEAGLPECTSHGLRKAGATLAAENGATTDELMAIFDWVTRTQADAYTRAVNRRKLARGAMHKLASEHERDGNVAVRTRGEHCPTNPQATVPPK